jgi:hypothetical protein
VSHIRFSFRPTNSGAERESSPSHGMIAEVGKKIPIYDDNRTEVGMGVITDLRIQPHDNLYGSNHRIDVSMEIRFVDDEEHPHLLHHFTGFSLHPADQPDDRQDYLDRRGGACDAGWVAWNALADSPDEDRYAVATAMTTVLDSFTDQPTAEATRKVSVRPVEQTPLDELAVRAAGEEIWAEIKRHPHVPMHPYGVGGNCSAVLNVTGEDLARVALAAASRVLGGPVTTGTTSTGPQETPVAGEGPEQSSDRLRRRRAALRAGRHIWEVLGPFTNHALAEQAQDAVDRAIAWALDEYESPVAAGTEPEPGLGERAPQPYTQIYDHGMGLPRSREDVQQAFDRSLYESSMCPDGARCHRSCGTLATSCYRVRTCGPMSGRFPNDEWPPEIAARHGRPDTTSDPQHTDDQPKKDTDD